MRKVSVLGLWHLGCIYSTSFAEKGFEVVGFDAKKTVVNNLRKGRAPIFEPGLDERIKEFLDKNLHFTSDPGSAVKNKNYIFITLDTPVDSQDRVQMEPFYELFNLVKTHIEPNTILVVSSQVPVGTCSTLSQALKTAGKKNEVIYFPENVRLGQAFQTFLKPDRIVLGASASEALNKFLRDFSFFDCPVLEMSLESAEMSKHALNSYLATLISFSSEIGDFCELTGANAVDVIKALKTDSRVSPSAPLNPGLGFAGGTLGRDLQTLKMVSKKINYTPKLAKAVYSVNQDRLPSLVKKITGKLGSLNGKEIGLLGLTYKPGTNTLRRSQSLELANLLKKAGAVIRAMDPAIKEQIKKYEFVKIVQSPDEFFAGLDAIILMTPWEEFKKLNPADFVSQVKQKVIFDTRNFLDKEAGEKAGFLFVEIGNGVKNTKAD